MPDEDNVIDVEAVEIVEGQNLPAVIEASTQQSRAETHGREAPIEGRDWSTYSRPERRCTAHSSRTGDQCKNAAIKGHNVCRYHGGAAKQIKQAAQTRLDNAAELMAKQLLGLALTAESEGVQLAAVKDALDRTIGKAPTTVEIGPTKPYEEVLTDLFDGVSTMSREESRRARGVSDAFVDIASLDGAHLHASSQGAQHQSSNPPTQSGTPHKDIPRDSSGRRDLLDRTTDTGDHHGSRDSAEYEASDSSDSPMHRERPRGFDRERDAGPPARHITGDDAIREANRANAQIGALKAIESGGHVRYRAHRR